MNDEIVRIYTDGACSGNPGRGGWGAIIRYKDMERLLSGYEEESTNNRMELTAAIRALTILNRPSKVELHTDSQYLRQGMSSWLATWKSNNWRTSSKKPVKNQDLWQLLDEQNNRHQIAWCWVKGHAGHPQNERADQLATQAIKEESGMDRKGKISENAANYG